MVLSLIAEGGSFTVAPSLGLVLWTVLVFLLIAVALYASVRLIVWLRRDRAGMR